MANCLYHSQTLLPSYSTVTCPMRVSLSSIRAKQLLLFAMTADRHAQPLLTHGTVVLLPLTYCRYPLPNFEYINTFAALTTHHNNGDIGFDQVMMMTIRNVPPQLEESYKTRTFSRAMREVVALCLSKEPHERPTAEELLTHRFFK